MTDAAPQESSLEIVMRVTQAHRRELLQTLERMRETVSREARVTGCEVLEDLMVPNRFCWIERWPTDADVRASLDSDRIAMLMAAIRLFGSVETVKRASLVVATPEAPSS
jgi:quinol monooxygenase YgiN